MEELRFQSNHYVMNKVIKYPIAEILLIGCILGMSYSNATFDGWALVAISTVVLMTLKKIRMLGVLTGVIMLILSGLLFLAALSEYYQCYNHEILIGGGLLTLLLLFIAVTFIYKYGYDTLKGLIGE